MDQTLSIVVPLHNAAATLRSRVVQMIETVSDLTDRFELIFVDDGSRDGTDEVAAELRHEYPQIRFLAHREPRGVDAAVRTGLLACGGDAVYIHEQDTPIRTADIRRLWTLRERDSDQLVMGRAAPHPKPLATDLIERLKAWGARIPQSPPAHHLKGSRTDSPALYVDEANVDA